MARKLIALWTAIVVVWLSGLWPSARQVRIARSFEITTWRESAEVGGATMNAVGEEAGTVGWWWMAGQASGAKTCSAGGGCQIAFPTASGVVWASGSTNVRIGFQDVDTSTGLPDGTFDAYADLVPGTETLASSDVFFFDVETGTKSVTHGDLVTINIEMTARGGTDVASAEVVDLGSRLGKDSGAGLPYSTADTGSTSKGQYPIPFFVQFDDGTYGWFEQVEPVRNFNLGRTTQAVNTGTTPDEVCAQLQLPISVEIDGFGTWLNAVATTDTFDYVIYENPTTSPSIIWGPVTKDPDQLLNDGMVRVSEDVLVLEKDTSYAFCFLPTSANSITYEGYFTLPSGSGVATAMKASSWFTEVKHVARSNGSGAFAETNALHMPAYVVHVVSVIEEAYGSFPVPMILSRLLPSTVISQ